MKLPAVFRNPLRWVLAAFRDSLITALSAFDKTSRKFGRVSTGAVKKNISQKQQSKKNAKATSSPTQSTDLIF